MVAIKVSGFAGERPLVIDRLLPETAAKVAFNVHLKNGNLRPINKPVEAGAAGAFFHQTIYKHQGVWLSWPGVVNVTAGPVASDRLYITGDGAPKLYIDDATYPLAVPRPAGALTATTSGGGSGDVISRTYVYTRVTDFGEESAPSPASNIEEWKPGETITLSGFALAAAGREITKQRIYRSQTGRTGTYFYLIAERDDSADDFTDDIAVDAFQEILPSSDWNAPPDDLAGLISMPNGMMAAFVGRDVYFCEPYRPHAWPEKYVMTVDSDVVGLAAIGSVLIVMTTGHPHLMSGATPDSMQGTKLESNFPCINARGIVDLGFAVCYPTNTGLVAVRGNGAINLATIELFDEKEWLSLSPSTMVGGQLEGEYVLFYDAVEPSGARSYGAIFINIDAAPFVVRVSELAAAVYFDVSESALYFKRAAGNGIYRLNAPNGSPMMFYWRSKEFVTTVPVSHGAVLIDLGKGNGLKSKQNVLADIAAIEEANDLTFAAGSLDGELNAVPVNTYPVNGDVLLPVPRAAFVQISVGVYGDGELVRAVTKAGSIERLPAKAKCRLWEFDVSSNIPVDQVIIAETVDELKQVL